MGDKRKQKKETENLFLIEHVSFFLSLPLQNFISKTALQSAAVTALYTCRYELKPVSDCTHKKWFHLELNTHTYSFSLSFVHILPLPFKVSSGGGGGSSSSRSEKIEMWTCLVSCCCCFCCCFCRYTTFLTSFSLSSLTFAELTHQPEQKRQQQQQRRLWMSLAERIFTHFCSHSVIMWLLLIPSPPPPTPLQLFPMTWLDLVIVCRCRRINIPFRPYNHYPYTNHHHHHQTFHPFKSPF